VLLGALQTSQNKVGGNLLQISLRIFPTGRDQFELVGLIGKNPEIDVVAAVLGGKGT
jgi:hypothetical protein